MSLKDVTADVVSHDHLRNSEDLGPFTHPLPAESELLIGNTRWVLSIKGLVPLNFLSRNTQVPWRDWLKRLLRHVFYQESLVNSGQKQIQSLPGGQLK
jgi:hypothetical protein